MKELTQPTSVAATPCGSAWRDCRPHTRAIARRDFLRLSSFAATGLAFSELPVMAGPFAKEDFEKLVPADKKLHPDWVKSLFERGTRTVYRWPESEKIGMPIGGICAGQLYLGGDGKLWHWDIFNQVTGTNDAHYAHPLKPSSPLRQGFALRVTAGGPSQIRALDHTGWSEVTFNGEYPIGFVEYRDPESPVGVSLEAFSPFIPLNTEDSALPATVLRFTIKNNAAEKVEAELAGWLENAVCLHSAPSSMGVRRNRIVRRSMAAGDQPTAVSGFTFLECSAEATPERPRETKRPDIVFDDFEKEAYEGWTTTGEAFGKGPVEQDKMPAYQGKVEAKGKRTVNSHASAPGQEVGTRDSATGTLTSRAFVVERDYITFLIGGGSHQGRTCLNLLVNGKAVLSATGKNDNRMEPHSFDVRPWAGQSAQLQIVDNEKGSWGNIGIDDIVFSDGRRSPLVPLAEQPDFGTMGLALLKSESRNLKSEISNLKSETRSPKSEGNPKPEARNQTAGAPKENRSSDFGLPSDLGFRPSDLACTSLPEFHVPSGLFSQATAGSDAPASKPFTHSLTGSLTRTLALAPGQSATVTFLVTWHFPNIKLDGLGNYEGRRYGRKFASALAVAEHVAQHFGRLATQTRLWHDTWYDSTLPYWFLDRTFLNTSILATNTCYWFGNGRFYAWEGVGCCAGTCGHVWQYAQALARLFPSLERDTRERVDFGLALQPGGAIFFRGEFNNIPAVDGQAGTILRALREHQTGADNAWLKKNWPGIRQSILWLIAKDANGDGLIESNQHNTLDTDWFGPAAWLSGLYLAALRAGEELAREMGDDTFARRCRETFERGQPNLVAQLFDGEYFINKPDSQHLDAINSGSGCHIDQVFGQSWAFQVGLPRVLPEKETRSALKSLWRYNFTPDVGPYREAHKAGRWYAMPGEAGLLMCTFPRSGWDYAQAKGQGPDWAAGYFNECMNGFEYQAAGHAIWEGMVLEGLAITRAVHDRYQAARRNPWNEVECGDHYARSMASYGVFLAACGYEHHGPRGHLGFAPRLTPGDFRCAFTTAEGWGTYSQKSEIRNPKSEIYVRWGRLRLRTVSLALQPEFRPTKVTVMVAGIQVPAALAVKEGKAEIRFGEETVVREGEKIEVELA